MSIKPICFNGEMVRAILAGRKTQTRRVIKPQPEPFTTGVNFPTYHHPAASSPQWKMHLSDEISWSAPWQPGDLLWVREPGRVVEVEEAPDCLYEWVRIEYLTDREARVVTIPQRMYRHWETKYDYGAPRWVWKKQGIPNGVFKEAARLFLKVTGVGIERIQDISEIDCFNEGLYCPGVSVCGGGCDSCEAEYPHDWFQRLWESISPGSWDKNEWVWVYAFERVEKPEGWGE